MCTLGTRILYILKSIKKRWVGGKFVRNNMIKSVYRSIFLSTTLLWVLSSFAFGDTGLSVKHAVRVGLEKNPGLTQILKRYEALNEVPSQVKSLPDPIVSVGLINFPTDTFNRSQEAMTNVQIGFSQYFPYPGKLDLKGEIAEFEATAAYHTVDEVRLLLVNHIESTWWQVYYFDRALETIRNNQELLRQFIQIAEEKYKTGDGLQQDVLLAQLELSKLLD